MGIENGLGDGTGLEQRKAQQNSISNTCPERAADVIADTDALDKHCVYGNAYDDEEQYANDVYLD